jgi:hypothetical protein
VGAAERVLSLLALSSTEIVDALLFRGGMVAEYEVSIWRVLGVLGALNAVLHFVVMRV